MPARAAFAHRPFKLWQAARLCSVFATTMQSVALGWHVYGATDSLLDLGLIGLAGFVPVALFSLVAGQVADRVDRRRLVSTCMAINASLSAALLTSALLVPDRVWPIYAVAVGLGTVKAFSGPAAKALLPALVPTGELANAVAWSSGLFQLATIGGPAVGGVLAGIDPAVAYAVAALLASVAAMLSTRVVPLRATSVAAASGILSGVRFVASQPILLGAITLDLGAVLIGGTTALLPAFARDILHAGAFGAGLLRASPAIGAGAMAIFLAHFPIAARAGRSLFVAVVCFGLATVGFGVSTSLVLSVACLILVGAADMVSVVVRGVLIQLATPDHMRGRVSAVSSVFIGASNELGELESGLAAAWLGAVPAVVAGGVAAIGIVLVCAIAFPALRRVDRLD